MDAHRVTDLTPASQVGTGRTEEADRKAKVVGQAKAHVQGNTLATDKHTILGSVGRSGRVQPLRQRWHHTWIQGPAGGSPVGEADFASGVYGTHVV